jgi:hypothetical protein
MEIKPSEPISPVKSQAAILSLLIKKMGGAITQLQSIT